LPIQPPPSGTSSFYCIQFSLKSIKLIYDNFCHKLDAVNKKKLQYAEDAVKKTDEAAEQQMLKIRRNVLKSCELEINSQKSGFLLNPYR